MSSRSTTPFNSFSIENLPFRKRAHTDRVMKIKGHPVVKTCISEKRSSDQMTSYRTGNAPHELTFFKMVSTCLLTWCKDRMPSSTRSTLSLPWMRLIWADRGDRFFGVTCGIAAQLCARPPASGVTATLLTNCGAVVAMPIGAE